MGEREGVDRIRIVSILELGDELGHGLVLGVQVEQYRDIAKLKRRVDECHLLAQLRRGGHGQVDGDRGSADTALGAEYGYDLTVFRRGEHPSRLRDDGPAGLLLLARTDLADRGRQFIAAEGLDQELARP